MNKAIPIISIILAFILSSSADTHYVTPGGNTPSSPYTTWGTATHDIQTAVDAASNGDTVVVSNGTYTLSSEIYVTKTLTIRSANGSEVTSVDGDGVCRGFNIQAATVIDGFTISHYCPV